MSRIAVFFPGIRYHMSGPLFYYAGRILMEYGFRIIKLPTLGGPIDSMNAGGDVMKLLPNAMFRAKKATENIDFDEYDEVVLVGKDLGCVAAALFAGQNSLDPSYVFFAPFEQTFGLVKGSSIVFYGDKGKNCNPGVIETFCSSNPIDAVFLENADDDLESDDIALDIKHISVIMKECGDFIRIRYPSIYHFGITYDSGEKKQLIDYRNSVLFIADSDSLPRGEKQERLIDSLYEIYKPMGFELIKISKKNNTAVFSFLDRMYGKNNDIKADMYLVDRYGFVMSGYESSEDAMHIMMDIRDLLVK